MLLNPQSFGDTGEWTTVLSRKTKNADVHSQGQFVNQQGAQCRKTMQMSGGPLKTPGEAPHNFPLKDKFPVSATDPASTMTASRKKGHGQQMPIRLSDFFVSTNPLFGSEDIASASSACPSATRFFESLPLSTASTGPAANASSKIPQRARHQPTSLVDLMRDQQDRQPPTSQLASSGVKTSIAPPRPTSGGCLYEPANTSSGKNGRGGAADVLGRFSLGDESQATGLFPLLADAHSEFPSLGVDAFSVGGVKQLLSGGISWAKFAELGGLDPSNQQGQLEGSVAVQPREELRLSNTLAETPAQFVWQHNPVNDAGVFEFANTGLQSSSSINNGGSPPGISCAVSSNNDPVPESNHNRNRSRAASGHRSTQPPSAEVGHGNFDACSALTMKKHGRSSSDKINDFGIIGSTGGDHLSTFGTPTSTMMSPQYSVPPPSINRDNSGSEITTAEGRSSTVAPPLSDYGTAEKARVILETDTSPASLLMATPAGEYRIVDLLQSGAMPYSNTTERPAWNPLPLSCAVDSDRCQPTSVDYDCHHVTETQANTSVHNSSVDLGGGPCVASPVGLIQGGIRSEGGGPLSSCASDETAVVFLPTDLRLPRSYVLPEDQFGLLTIVDDPTSNTTEAEVGSHPLGNSVSNQNPEAESGVTRYSPGRPLTGGGLRLLVYNEHSPVLSSEMSARPLPQQRFGGEDGLAYDGSGTVVFATTGAAPSSLESLDCVTFGVQHLPPEIVSVPQPSTEQDDHFVDHHALHPQLAQSEGHACQPSSSVRSAADRTASLGSDELNAPIIRGVENPGFQAVGSDGTFLFPMTDEDASSSRSVPPVNPGLVVREGYSFTPPLAGDEKGDPRATPSPEKSSGDQVLPPQVASVVLPAVSADSITGDEGQMFDFVTFGVMADERTLHPHSKHSNRINDGRAADEAKAFAMVAEIEQPVLHPPVDPSITAAGNILRMEDTDAGNQAVRVEDLTGNSSPDLSDVAGVDSYLETTTTAQLIDVACNTSPIFAPSWGPLKTASAPSNPKAAGVEFHSTAPTPRSDRQHPSLQISGARSGGNETDGFTIPDHTTGPNFDNLGVVEPQREGPWYGPSDDDSMRRPKGTVSRGSPQALGTTGVPYLSPAGHTANFVGCDSQAEAAVPGGYTYMDGGGHPLQPPYGGTTPWLRNAVGRDDLTGEPPDGRWGMHRSPPISIPSRHQDLKGPQQHLHLHHHNRMPLNVDYPHYPEMGCIGSTYGPPRRSSPTTDAATSRYPAAGPAPPFAPYNRENVAIGPPGLAAPFNGTQFSPESVPQSTNEARHEHHVPYASYFSNSAPNYATHSADCTSGGRIPANGACNRDSKGGRLPPYDETVDPQYSSSSFAAVKYRQVSLPRLNMSDQHLNTKKRVTHFDDRSTEMHAGREAHTRQSEPSRMKCEEASYAFAPAHPQYYHPESLREGLSSRLSLTRDHESGYIGTRNVGEAYGASRRHHPKTVDSQGANPHITYMERRVRHDPGVHGVPSQPVELDRSTEYSHALHSHSHRQLFRHQRFIPGSDPALRDTVPRVSRNHFGNGQGGFSSTAVLPSPTGGVYGRHGPETANLGQYAPTTDYNIVGAAGMPPAMSCQMDDHHHYGVLSQMEAPRYGMTAAAPYPSARHKTDICSSCGRTRDDDPRAANDSASSAAHRTNYNGSAEVVHAVGSGYLPRDAPYRRRIANPSFQVPSRGSTESWGAYRWSGNCRGGGSGHGYHLSSGPTDRVHRASPVVHSDGNEIQQTQGQRSARPPQHLLHIQTGGI